MTITLCLLPPGRSDLIEGLDLPPEQHQFSDPPAVVMAKAQGKRDGHVICENGIPVGFFAIEPDYPQAHEFAEADAIGVRMFSVDYRSQGRGIASAACQLLTEYLPQHYPSASAVYLTVNHRNPGAKRVYLKGGFEDTGEDYLGGGSGPQDIMRLAL